MYSIVNVCSVNCVYSDHTVRKGEERLNGEEKAEGERIQKGEERQSSGRDRGGEEEEVEERQTRRRYIYRGEEETTRKERKGTGKTEGRRDGGVGETMHGEQV